VVRGKAIALTADSIRLTVTGSRGGAAKLAREGEGVIPASLITTIKVNRNGILGRIIGTSTLLGLTLAALLSGGETPTGSGIAVIVAMPAAGYGIGWLIDRESLLIRIVP
jgi:hypothetical protein